jgi:apolipoprotein N-acyltransferase
MAEFPGVVFRAVGPLAPLQRAALWCAELTGWRRYLLAVLLGAIAADALPQVAFPHLTFPPLLVLSFSGLVWLQDGSTRRGSALLLGWSFGFGFFFVGLYWIAAALFVDIAQFWWFVPFVALGFPAGLAAFPALALLGAHEVCRQFHLAGSPRILVLAAAWGAAEWLRGHILTGFPWNLVGYTWSSDLPGALAVLQASAVLGIYGLSVVTVLAAALPARLGDLGRFRLPAVIAALLLVAVPAAAGSVRLWQAKNEMVPGVKLRLVQPSIPETLKNDPRALAENFGRLLALSMQPGEVTDIVWPEAAAPPLLERYPGLRRRIAAVIPKGGLLLTGVERAEPLQGWPPAHAWNSLEVLDDTGEVIATYDKAHLVPFGEYVPLRGILPMEKVAPSIGDFTPGPGPRTLDLPGLPPVSVLICYEAIFPGAVVDPADRPQWLLNVTNDAWYGRTSGPFQHLAIARVRAVEEGLPLVRAGNNGISAVFDGYGRLSRRFDGLPARLDLDAIGVLDTGLPAALEPTPYERWRDRVFWAALLVLIAAAAVISLADRYRRA